MSILYLSIYSQPYSHISPNKKIDNEALEHTLPQVYMYICMPEGERVAFIWDIEMYLP